MTTFDFQDGNGPVPARQHSNGGGWVADTAWVYGNAQVAGTAWVYGNAQVFSFARVSGNARVFGNAQVSGIMRGDGYCFVYVPCADSKYRVIAGCRYFTMSEARAHWGKAHAKHEETTAILNALEALAPFNV